MQRSYIDITTTLGVLVMIAIGAQVIVKHYNWPSTLPPINKSQVESKQSPIPSTELVSCRPSDISVNGVTLGMTRTEELVVCGPPLQEGLWLLRWKDHFARSADNHVVALGGISLCINQYNVRTANELKHAIDDIQAHPSSDRIEQQYTPTFELDVYTRNGLISKVLLGNAESRDHNKYIASKHIYLEARIDPTTERNSPPSMRSSESGP